MIAVAVRRLMDQDSKSWRISEEMERDRVRTQFCVFPRIA